jgi:hypothetical protein
MHLHRRDSAPETAGSDSPLLLCFAYAYLRENIDRMTMTSDKYS